MQESGDWNLDFRRSGDGGPKKRLDIDTIGKVQLFHYMRCMLHFILSTFINLTRVALRL